MTHKYYCAICWQEFDNPRDHNAGSFFGRERLNGFCKGDIRAAEGRWRESKKTEPMPLLDLDAGEPIKL